MKGKNVKATYLFYRRSSLAILFSLKSDIIFCFTEKEKRRREKNLDIWILSEENDASMWQHIVRWNLRRGICFLFRASIGASPRFSFEIRKQRKWEIGCLFHEMSLGCFIFHKIPSYQSCTPQCGGDISFVLLTETM